MTYREAQTKIYEHDFLVGTTEVDRIIWKRFSDESWKHWDDEIPEEDIAEINFWYRLRGIKL